MSLTAGLASTCDLFKKLQHDAELLNESVTSYKFFNFVITGYSLIDWIKNDPNIPASAKAEFDDLHKEPWLKVCGDLANSSKHFTLTRRKPVTESVNVKTGFGVGRYGVGEYGIGEIEIRINNGTSWTALEFVAAVLQVWIKFFERHGIAP